MTEKLAGVDQKALLADLRKQVVALEDDLRERSDEEPVAADLKAEYQRAFDAKRTAATFGAWRDARVTQVAVAWILGMVFVRFCEDNDLIAAPFVAGPGERLADAEERHEAYFRENPTKNDRDWIVESFNHLAACNETVAGLFDHRYNPLWEISPSFEAATALLTFWRRRDASGEIVHDFSDPSRNTRFLGDLYQDLSEHARKTYALLQTPEFVEEFILDLTLTPALAEFGLKGLRTIDPACGSGHFLLGIFARLVAAWREAEPGTDDWELIRRSLESVHGCDKNPFAASVARFRLLIAALEAAGERRLDRARTFPINVAVGDSLLHGRGAPHWHQDELFSLDEPHTYRTEDVDYHVERCDLLGRGSYHVVVGNPPYITPKDKQENENYRIGYKSCSGKYALSVPFAECLFQLAIRAMGAHVGAGFVGQITANSFMKREFGKKLIEQCFPMVNLTHIIDSSGAYVPGHGTPTVILVGRNSIGRMDRPIRAALGVRGEPAQPVEPSNGAVWSAIVNQIDTPGSESEWISVEDRTREAFYRYPWALGGGGSADLVDSISGVQRKVANLLSRDIGFASFSGVDDAFYLPMGWHRRNATPPDLIRPMVLGDNIRDWGFHSQLAALCPYDGGGQLIQLDPDARWARHLWRYKQIAGNLTDFARQTRFQAGIAWWSWYRWVPERYSVGKMLAFSHVSTHFHCGYGEANSLFSQHSPVITMAAGTGRDEYLALLGVLNSSTACFWLKQVSHNKGNEGYNSGIKTEMWERFYEFTGTKLQEFSLPRDLAVDLGQAMDALARELSGQEPAYVAAAGAPSRFAFDSACERHTSIRQQMVAIQEELDWHTYGLYDLLSAVESAGLVAKDFNEVPEIVLGERAFEIVMARKMAAGELETAWFTRHNSTPITEIPTRWPDWYRDIVQARIDTIEKRKDIALIERPECKRRWSSEPWEKKEERALRTWLLDLCEREDLWFTKRDGMRHPRTLTINQLADQLRDDKDFADVADLYATDHLGKRDAPLAQVLTSILTDEHVPHLAALRYKDTGLRKREQWEHVWDLQREEDRTGERLDIPVPPKYTSADFRKNSYWSHRGKLDVPKERFISYPESSPESDETLLLGWAGWDHRDQAQALVNIVNDRVEQSAWDAVKLTPVFAGLAEIMPWVKQWHSGYDAEWDGDPAEEFQAFLDSQRAKYHVTEQDLKKWRPTAPTRGRKAKTGVGQ